MEIRINDTFTKVFFISEEMIEDFANVTGDKNPIHLDENYAKDSIFQSRIAHGFLIGSLISSVLGNDYPGNGTIYLSQNMKFLKPVFIGDTIKVEITVNEFAINYRMVLKTDCINQHGKTVIAGEATIIPPGNITLIR